MELMHTMWNIYRTAPLALMMTGQRRCKLPARKETLTIFSQIIIFWVRNHRLGLAVPLYTLPVVAAKLLMMVLFDALFQSFS